VTDRPIIFSGPMVRALLDGRKTQTRRLATSPLTKCLTGDTLWVRETCRAVEQDDGRDLVEFLAGGELAPINNSRESADRWMELAHYGNKGRRFVQRDEGGVAGPWVPSIHMPRWCSRLMLHVDAKRVEPLQNISEADAIAEGIYETGGGRWNSSRGGPSAYSPPTAYRALWKKLHGADSWDANPDVLVLTFAVAT
jgi:hypothetical protein